MSYLYASNNDPQAGFTQLEIQLDTGDAALLTMGHYYDLSASELARARRYVTLVSGTATAEDPIGIVMLPIKGNPTSDQIPQWSTNEAAFVPATVSGVSGGPYASVASVAAKADQTALDAVESRAALLGVNVESQPYSASTAASGATNRTAIQDAITAAGILGTHVQFPTKGATYAINDAIVNPGVKMVGDNVTLDGSAIAAAGAGSTQFGLKIQGSLSGSALVSTGAFTATSAVLAIPTATLAAGDVLIIASSTQLYMDGVSGATEKRQELRRIKTVDNSAQCTLTEGLRFSYTSGATTTAQKVNMVDRPRVEGVKILMGGLGKIHNGILFTYCYDPVASNVKIDGCEDTGVQFSYCWGGQVTGRCDIVNCTSPVSVTTTGYGVVMVDATRDVKINTNRIRNCRHAVAGGSCAVDARVFDNDIEDNGIASGASLDTHEATFGFQFDFNRISGAKNVGVLLRGQGAKARWNVVRGTASHGILVKSFDTNSDGLNNTEVIGNDIDGTGGAGIRWEGTSVCPVKGGVYHSNTIKNSTLNNATFLLTFDLEVGANRYDTSTGSGSDGNNMRFVGTGAGDRCERITVRGGWFKDAALRWLSAAFAEELTIEDPFVVNNANNTFLTGPCTNTQVNGARGPGAPALRQTNATNANFTISAMVTSPTVIQTASVSSSDKTVTLATTNLHEALEFTIVRQDAGGFNHLVLNGAAGPQIASIPAHGWARFGRDATNANWIVLGAGTGV